MRERGKLQRKALLESAPVLLRYLEAGGIRDDLEGPLFRPVAKDRATLLRRPLPGTTIWGSQPHLCRILR